MNKKLLCALMQWPKSYIRDQELTTILQEKSDDAKAALIKRACHEKFLQRLRRGLYLIPFKNAQNPVDLFEVAGILYGPSYISFEASLAYHGWIPEAVYTITSATTRRTKTIATPLARFVYTKMATSGFFDEVTTVNSPSTQFLMAAPWKALADLICLQKKKYDKIQDLFEDLRIEYETLRASNIDSLKTLCSSYPHCRTRKILQKLLKGLAYE
jgi:predicted transcriptional regulator of viral defense system